MGTVTPGNASGINDGGAAVVFSQRGQVVRRNLSPLGRLVSWGLAGCRRKSWGVGPVKAVPIALERSGLTLADIDVIESNEAFAAQALAVCDGLGLSSDKINPNGGAIALGTFIHSARRARSYRQGALRIASDRGRYAVGRCASAVDRASRWSSKASTNPNYASQNPRTRFMNMRAVENSEGVDSGTVRHPPRNNRKRAVRGP